MVELARGKCARLFSVNPEEIIFLSNASEGINNLAYGLDLQPGDNVVIADVEFPSGILPGPASNPSAWKFAWCATGTGLSTSKTLLH